MALMPINDMVNTVEVNNALALQILSARLVGAVGKLTSAGTTVKARVGRLGRIEAVVFGHMGDVRVLFYVYAVGSDIPLNTESWTREYRPLTHLELM